MHSTQRAFFGRKGNAVLRIVGFKPTRRKLVDAEGAGKETARVAGWLELNEPSIGQCGRVKLHVIPSIAFNGDKLLHGEYGVWASRSAAKRAATEAARRSATVASRTESRALAAICGSKRC